MTEAVAAPVAKMVKKDPAGPPPTTATRDPLCSSRDPDPEIMPLFTPS